MSAACPPDVVGRRTGSCDSKHVYGNEKESEKKGGGRVGGRRGRGEGEGGTKDEASLVVLIENSSEFT